MRPGKSRVPLNLGIRQCSNRSFTISVLADFASGTSVNVLTSSILNWSMICEASISAHVTRNCKIVHTYTIGNRAGQYQRYDQEIISKV